ncbi:MAG: PAS domain-containing protein [Oligoflexia bacterium]|nr:PAS domain-containing protein [Oligoflexia bacterium]
MSHIAQKGSPAPVASYLELFDRIQDCVVILDEDTHVILDINQRGVDLFGQPKEKLVGRAVTQWLEPSCREDFAHAVRVFSRRADWHRFDTVWKLAEDRTVTLEISVSSLRVVEYSGVLQLIAREVTQKRSAESSGSSSPVSHSG